MKNMIQLTVDGQITQAEENAMLLGILDEKGIHVPRLCHHPSLAPSGACRLCVVEVSKESWQGNSKIVTSCLYPAEEGLIVSTRSEKVLKTRRDLLQLYLAAYPGSKTIQDLARAEGIDSTNFKLQGKENLCIMCGLCTRVCQDLGPGAISTLGRGAEKEVGPGPGIIAEDCTGCRTCAHLCPTGAISLKQQDQVLTIWDRHFEIPVCSVNTELCRGCGICEEVCPYSVPRVSMFKNGLSVSRISPASCVGCGICAGSCPAGAIEQKKTEALDDFSTALYQRSLQDKTIVFACPRSPLPADTEEVIPVSCIGRVDTGTLLYCVAAGAKGVALICRDRASCPYGRGGALGEERVLAARELLKLCGLEKERIALLKPQPGPEGPYGAWQDFRVASSGFDPVSAVPYTLKEGGLSAGLDLALDIASWLKELPDLKPVLPETIRALFSSEEKPSALLYLERLPELSLLLEPLLTNSAVSDILAQAARLLQEKNISVRPVVAKKELMQKGVAQLITFSPQTDLNLSEEMSSITMNELAGFDKGQEEAPFTFHLSARERKRLLEAHSAAKDPYFSSTPEQSLQYALLHRRGAWQQSLTKTPPPLFTASLAGIDEAGAFSEARRVTRHPILPPPAPPELEFTFNGQPLTALKGEVITSALYAAGITTFGHHPKDGGAQGLYCANGQCSQCMVIVNGKPVKGCMTPVTAGMAVQSVDAPPALTDDTLAVVPLSVPHEEEVEVLIVGGGPAGICAAIELGRVGVEVLIVDDKQDLGGKLSLQTHNFFGSVDDCYAGTRGVEIGRILAGGLTGLPSVKTWLNATVVGVFSDRKFGVSKDGVFKLVRAKRVLFATGAREKSLYFPGCDLPGVYGAGAFQTLVNRDLVRCAERLFIIGGGNVGLIGAYHALQAGIEVVGLVEALPRCGGYKVHEDKIKRLGVPVWTSHTVLRIEGDKKVERVVVAQVDDHFKPVPGSVRSYEVDTVLMAVGLSPVDELLEKAKEYGMAVYAAGDAEEIAEASAAIFSGKITGRKIARDMGIDLPIPSNWETFGQMLKHKPGQSSAFIPPDTKATVYPLIRCVQEIPCNPCTQVCPNDCITMKDSILSLPEFSGECIGCGRCVLACPGLAITVVVEDYDPDQEKALLIMPFEFVDEMIPLGSQVTTTDMVGAVVGEGRVLAYKDRESQDKRRLLLVEVPFDERHKVASFRIGAPEEGTPAPEISEEHDPIVCRCERVRKSEIVKEIRAGVRDMNQLKATVRTGLGSCNGKTCTDLILRIFREEGVLLDEVTTPTHRPLVAEMHLSDFITAENEEKD